MHRFSLLILHAVFPAVFAGIIGLAHANGLSGVLADTEYKFLGIGFSGNLTSPTLEVSVYIEPPQNETLHMENQLKDFVTRLRAFSHDTGFAIDEFEWVAEELERKLSSLTNTVESSMPSRKLAIQLEFAQFMFYAMIDLVAHLKYFGSLDLLEIQLTNKLIETKFGALALVNYWGVPDNQIQGYTLAVIRLHQTLDLCKSHFENLDAVPYVPRYMFETRLSEMHLIVGLLDARIPRHEDGKGASAAK